MSLLITGAAGGIGRAGLEALQASGSSVLGHDLMAGLDNEVAFTGDLIHPQTLESTLAAVRRSGGLHGVVAAHGIEGAGALHEISESDAARVLAVNFASVIELWEQSRADLEACHGVFVVIASQAGLVAEAGNGLYSASKAALAGWFRGLDSSTDARLRLIYPGATETPLLRRALSGMASARDLTYDDLLSERFSGIPAGRIGTPHEIGHAIRWAVNLPTKGLVELAITGGEVQW